MKQRIHLLPDQLVAQIAAGEVIESPAAVVKELIENSLDAGATEIELFLKDSGFDLIQIKDNGSGIYKDDLPYAVASFATSKLDKIDDLQQILSYGFRGEALGSIRSVSRLRVESAPSDQQAGFGITACEEDISEIEPVAMPDGTRIRVEDLFFNTPVRKEFIKDKKKILQSILETVSIFSMAMPELYLRVENDGREHLLLPPAETLSERINQIYGDDYSGGLIPLFYSEETDVSQKIELRGFISNFDFYRSSGRRMQLYINRRPVSYNRLTGILRRAYGELMPPGRFPVAFLFLKAAPSVVDVNVHPQKKEVRFKNEDFIYSFINRAVRNVIENSGPFSVNRMVHPQKKVVKSFNTEGRVQEEKLNFHLPLEPSVDAGPETGEDDLQAYGEPVRFLPEKVHARLFRTFLLASSEEGIYLIDQHTAHERINYEMFLEKLEREHDVSQTLVEPVRLDTGPAERYRYEVNKELLHKVGFEISDMGPAGWQIDKIPFYLKPGEEQAALDKALRIIEDKGDIEAVQLFDEMAKSLSCRHSTRKGDDESVANLGSLLNRLSACKVPGRCPHGRPTMVFLGRDDIFHLFKRKPD